VTVAGGAGRVATPDFVVMKMCLLHIAGGKIGRSADNIRRWRGFFALFIAILSIKLKFCPLFFTN